MRWATILKHQWKTLTSKVDKRGPIDPCHRSRWWHNITGLNTQVWSVKYDVIKAVADTDSFLSPRWRPAAADAETRTLASSKSSRSLSGVSVGNRLSAALSGVCSWHNAQAHRVRQPPYPVTLPGIFLFVTGPTVLHDRRFWWWDACAVYLSARGGDQCCINVSEKLKERDA